VHIALIGKYVELPDAYKSINEAFIHASAINECKVNLVWLKAELLAEPDAELQLANYDGILVAPGFGERGLEGKIKTVRFARENNIPFFGICLGMQCAVIDFARNVLGLPDAHTTEAKAETTNPVISIMEEQKKVEIKGGTMRLGAYVCDIQKDSIAYSAYNNQPQISERHRHRYEFNNEYLERFTEAGMLASGINPNTGLVEIIELKNHRYFIGVQFHPELKSTVVNPHPLFVRFVKEAIAYKADK